MSRFYFGDSDSEDSNDENALPYPKPLARSAFLTPDFSPTEFLSSLHNRHQALEDLRLELRTRSQELNRELLDLVNDNYQDFLGLGSSLKGGEEKVEEVRLGLLRFRREVDSLKENVAKRRGEVEELYEERKKVSEEMKRGRNLLEVNTRLEELEEALRIGINGDSTANSNTGLSDFTESDESEDEHEHSLGHTISGTRLTRRIQQFIHLQRLIDKTGKSHPYLIKQEERISKVRQTLLIDLGNALSERRAGTYDDRGILKLLALYKDLDEPQALMQAVRGQKV